MADWYVSSAAYAAIAAFTPSVAYSVGDIRKPTAPALKAQWVFRCTTAGTASTEPTWTTPNNSTITTGGATFTNITGQSTFGWSAAAGDIPTLIGAVGTFRFAAGDRMFVSSDHSEAQTTLTTYGSGTGTASYASGQVLSVNRAGSVPPGPADLIAGASIADTGSGISLDSTFPVYHYGITYACSGVSGIIINSTGSKSHYFDACQLFLSGAAQAGAKIMANSPSSVILNNSTLRFSNTSQQFTSTTGVMELIWLNTISALAGAVFPINQLFTTAANNVSLSIIARGVDLSALTGTFITQSSNNCGLKALLDGCRIASGLTRYNITGVVNTRDEVELVNCYDGTNFISERWVPAGAVTTEFTITLSGGATDNVGTFSHKMVSSANVDKYVNPLTGFWMDVNYATTGSAKTATVEIISSAVLNNDEISLELEYLGTTSSSLASFTNSLPATVLTTASAVTTSTATWNSSPATPQKQKLQVTFTPRAEGRVRGRVRLGKASTTCYYDPQVTIT
jgi:hypothetical protein